jgi:hypothetical protein
MDVPHRGLKNQGKKDKTRHHFSPSNRTSSSLDAASEAIRCTPETTRGRGGRSLEGSWSRRGKGGLGRWDHWRGAGTHQPRGRRIGVAGIGIFRSGFVR